jgi:polar amino acid transport system permease protein
MPFMMILVLYFAMASLISFAMRALERHLARGLDGVRA